MSNHKFILLQNNLFYFSGYLDNDLVDWEALVDEEVARRFPETSEGLNNIILTIL